MMLRFSSLLLVASVLGGCDQLTQSQDQLVQNQMDDIYGKVANDAVQQYTITVQSGGPIDRCVQAGFVAAAYLQAQDQANYANWKAIEANDCAAAGISK